jgi:hypothetical protein
VKLHRLLQQLLGARDPEPPGAAPAADANAHRAEAERLRLLRKGLTASQVERALNRQRLQARGYSRSEARRAVPRQRGNGDR